MSVVSLSHHFLVAMPAMVDLNFARTLIYICEHNHHGALGIIVNRPLDMTLSGLFERVSLPLDADPARTELADLPVYFGGPMQTDRGFVLHRPPGNWNSSLDIADDIALTSSRDILQAMSEVGQPSDALITLGYAGWARGQLEEELAQNAWLTVAAEPRIIFETPPDQRLAAAMRLLGLDYARLSGVAGHA